jgi:signal transduction histidine kinase
VAAENRTVSTLGNELELHHEAIVQRWYEAWQRTAHDHPDVSEAALKDSLGAQLCLIGEQLQRLPAAEAPADLWKRAERLEPELRVGQAIAIEEVVQEYGLAVDVVRQWVAERSLNVTFEEYSYFFQAMYELTAESVRRYAKHQAELVGRDRAQYLAAVMHQLRTPLAVLSLALHHPPIAVSELAPRLERAVRRITTLVEGVLRLERYRPEDLPVHPRDVDVAHHVQEVLTDHAHDARRKNVRVEVCVPESLRMNVDPDLLTDALGNLVQNAVKYTSAGSVRVDVTSYGHHVCFEVRDTGPGMARDELATLFHSARPGRHGGAGIGLLIAQRAARAMGGGIDVESEPGRGSVFRLRLPQTVTARDAAG